MVLVIDNYDSFTYNLVQYVGRFYKEIEVYRNDKISVSEIASKKPGAIIISPGPKTPKEAGISCELIDKLFETIPILGVCLGHQSIGQVFGGNIVRAPEIMHGKISSIVHDGIGCFTDLPTPIEVVRYHSLIIEKKSLPDCLEICATVPSPTTGDDIIMAVRHKDYPSLEGVQFHPESIKTQSGYELIENFLSRAKLI